MAKRGLAVLLALYLGLAVGYAVVTPFGHPPDETAHALYVQQLAERHGLPVLRRARRDAYESHQPPLYYTLAAPAWAAAAHMPPVAAHAAARGVSILIGALGVWLIAALAAAASMRQGAARDALTLGAAGFAALLPMRLATAASISNDTLAEAVFTGSLLLMVQLIRRGATARRAAALGLCLGVGILTKSSDLLLFPVALLALLFACQTPDAGHASAVAGSEVRPSEKSALTAHGRRLDPSLFLRCAAATFGVALLIGGGWMIRNAQLYGDPLGTKAFEQYFQDTATPAALEQLLGYSGLDLLVRKVLPLTFDSFWGVFGHMQLFMGAYPKGAEAPGWTSLLADHGYPPPSWLYSLLLLPTLIAAAGLLRSGVRYWVFGVRYSASGPTPNTEYRTPNTGHLAAILALTWFLVVAAFLRFNTEFFQAQGRYLFPAMGPTAIGFAAGWLAWWPTRRQGIAALALLAGMLALALFALCGTLVPAFAGG